VNDLRVPLQFPELQVFTNGFAGACRDYPCKNYDEMGREIQMNRSSPDHLSSSHFSPEGGFPLQTRWFALALSALVIGVLGGVMLTPQPAGAVNKDMIELQQQVSQILQNQQDLRSAMDTNNATMKTLIQQSLDSVSQMNTQMTALQRSVQEVQANTGSRIDSMTQQTQGISDNLQDVQARVGKLGQQLSDMQNILQSIDAKVSNAAGAPGAAPPPTGPTGPTGAYPPPATAPSGPSSYSGTSSNGSGAPYSAAPAASNGNGMAPNAMAPISSDTLYHNALRDYTTANYELSRQEFADYIHNFPSTDLASNSQFYLGEIAYSQGDYKSAITAYDLVITKYPQSIKQAAALLKKAQAENNLKEKTSAIRDLREVVSKYPGSDESRRARTLLQGMGVSASAPRGAH
jgi:tol-pal system protein YbgF